ncbi:glycosyltransferase [Pyrobaculum sp.]|uniref:glycosyltransferase n=1 Tax=Pyrobaculum sp. TaxID=2004705 RepID=UPI00317AEFCD
MSKPLITIIIPTLNECHNIPMVLKEIHKRFSKEAEIIIVDGGSIDCTLDKAKEVSQTLGMDVKLIRQKSSGGKPGALIDGFKEARGLYVGVIDADMEFHPSDLERMYREALKGYDVVLGYRRDVRPFWRRVISWGARLLAKIMIPSLRRFKDPTTEMYVISKHSLDTCIDKIKPRIKPALEILAKCKANSYKEIEIMQRQRSLGESKFSIMWIFQYIWQLLELTNYFTVRYIAGALVALPVSILLWNYVGLLAPFVGAIVKWLFIFREVGPASTLTIKALAVLIKIAGVAPWPITALIEFILIHMLRGTKI